MKCESFVWDPAPDAERGTLEYAASAALREEFMRIVMSRQEAAKLLQCIAGLIPQTGSVEFVVLRNGLRNFLL